MIVVCVCVCLCTICDTTSRRNHKQNHARTSVELWVALCARSQTKERKGNKGIKQYVCELPGSICCSYPSLSPFVCLSPSLPQHYIHSAISSAHLLLLIFVTAAFVCSYFIHWGCVVYVYSSSFFLLLRMHTWSMLSNNNQNQTHRA